MASGRTSATSSGVISGSGLAMAKMMGLSAIDFTIALRHGAGGGEAEEGVGALQRIGQRARLGLGGIGRLPLVHAFGAALVDDALGVAEDHVLPRHAHGGEQLEAGDARGAGAVDDELEGLEIAPGQLERIEEAGGGDDGGAVLVVVEDGDVEQLFELLLDDEAVRRLDVLQVDAAEAGAQIAHAIDDGIDVRSVDQDVDGVDVGEALEQRALAFHHGLGRLRAEIAEAEDRRAVGDDGHHVALVGVVVGELGIAGDGQHRHRHARRIGERQIALRRERLGRRDLELAGLALAVELQRFLLGEVRGGELDGHMVVPLRQLRSCGMSPALRTCAEGLTIVGSAHRHNVRRHNRRQAAPANQLQTVRDASRDVPPRTVRRLCLASGSGQGRHGWRTTEKSAKGAGARLGDAPARAAARSAESRAGTSGPAVTPPGVTPSMAQFLEIKAANPDCLLFYRMGDFYELFFEDAVAAAQALGIVLTKRGKHLGEDIPMCGVPIHRADEYLQRLIRQGFRVAVCEQLEDPAEARKRGSKAVVRRDVVRLVTPGTLTEDSLLDAKARNYLTAVFDGPKAGRGQADMIALASLDISTGEFEVGEVPAADFPGEIVRLSPSEVIAADRLFADEQVRQWIGIAGAAATPVPGASFDSLAGERLLKAQLGVADLQAFGDFSQRRARRHRRAPQVCRADADRPAPVPAAAAQGRARQPPRHRCAEPGEPGAAALARRARGRAACSPPSTAR